MTSQIKLNFRIDYKKSELEEGLEKVIGQAGSKLSNPIITAEFDTGEMTNVRRKAKIEDVEIIYRRLPDIYDALNFGQRCETEEWITIKYKNFKGSNEYAFNLNSNKRLMEDFGADFSMNEIAPRYNGILTTRHTVNKDGTEKTPRITRKRFLSELDSILNEYVSYLNRHKH